jgi:hypothetical protein
MALAAIVLAGRAIEESARVAMAISSGVLAGLALLLRVLGAPIAAGLFLAIALRSGWRKSTAFAAGAAPFFIAMSWRSLVSVPQRPPNTGASCALAWQRTWLYYTNYFAYWKAASIDSHTLWQYIGTNSFATFLQPPAYFLDIHLIRPTGIIIVLFILLWMATVRGLVRQGRTSGWHVIYFALTFYLVPVLLWDYTTVDRYLIPFLPLFAAGLSVESSYLATQIRASLGKQGDVGAKITAGFFGLLGAALFVAVSISWWQGTNFVKAKCRQHGALLVEKREAYQWLRENTPPNVKFIAYEDASAFLYSARQGMRPTIFLPAGMYRPDVLNSDLSCRPSVRVIGSSQMMILDSNGNHPGRAANPENPRCRRSSPCYSVAARDMSASTAWSLGKTSPRLIHERDF